jgi:hypothetical protein
MIPLEKILGKPGVSDGDSKLNSDIEDRKRVFLRSTIDFLPQLANVKK